MRLTLPQKAQAAFSVFHYKDEIRDHLYRRYWQNRKVMSVIVEGVTVNFDTSDFLSNTLFYQNDTPGAYEPAVSQLLGRLIKKSKIYADIGANIGYFTVLPAVINPECGIYSFEVDPSLKPIVLRNMRQNGVSENQVTIINAAVGDQGGEIRFHHHPGGFLAMQAREKLDPYDLKFSAPMVRLDDYFAEQGVTPDLLKIDVDGAELHVLRGMTSILETKPDMLLEVHFTVLPKYGATMQEVYDFLRPFGYSYYLVEDFRNTAGVLKLIKNFDDLKSKSGDMLFLTHASQ
jgi:FkbM family methyltransferase